MGCHPLQDVPSLRGRRSIPVGIIERDYFLAQSGHGHWSQPQPVHASRIMGAFYPPDDPGDALRSNPFYVGGLAAAIELALEFDEDDRRRRVERMAGRGCASRRLRVDGAGARNDRGSAYGSLTVETVLIIADERRLYVLSRSVPA